MPTLCPGCFERDAPSSGEACPRCGYSEGQDRSPLALPLRTELKGRYQVGRVLGEPGGFGVTYLAFDQRLELRVAIKEYVPRELAGRGSDGVSVAPYSTGDQEEFEYGLERFLGEAKALAQFDHANIVSVRDFFEANGTAYLVMDYYEGKTLKQYLSEQPEGRMEPETATEIILRVLDGLREVHAKEYLHRDVKPDNIYLTAEGRPILIDFGAARLALGERSRSLSVVMTPGYAPYEQYRREGDQGPHTDVYGCGATLYRMVTGQKPPAATDRIVDDTLEPPHRVNPTVPEALGEAVVEALAPGNKERLGTAEALQERLQAGLRAEEEETSSTEQSPVEWQKARDRASRQWGSPHDASRPEQSPERTAASEPVESSEPTGGPGGEGRAGSTSSTETEEGRVRGGRQEAKDESKGIDISPYAVVGVLAVLLGGVGVALYSGGGTGTDSQVQAEETTSQTGSQTEPGASGNERPSAEEREARRIDRLLEEARTDLQADRLTTPEGESAYDAVQKVLEIDPGNAEAESLRGQIADRYVELAEDAKASGDLQQAATYFSRSLNVQGRRSIRKRLESVRSRIQKKMRVERLLTRSRSTLDQQSPSIDVLQEAKSTLRKVLRLDVKNKEAERLMKRIDSRLASKESESESNSARRSGFTVTSRAYPETLNLKQIVKDRFGPKAEIADWSNIKSRVSATEAGDWADRIGLSQGGDAWVERNGNRWHSGGDRHYFIKRHGGEKSPSFLAHDDIGGYILSLGSWYGTKKPILVNLGG